MSRVYSHRRMPIDPELKEILCCPKCKGELEFSDEQDRIVCHRCKLVYRVDDGIPVMLIDEASPLAG